MSDADFHDGGEVIPRRKSSLNTPVNLVGATLCQQELPALRTVEDAAAVLRERGEVLHDQDGRLVAALGDHAYTVCEGAEGSMISTTDLPHLHDQLRDKRIWWPSNFSNVEGAGPLERAYTQFGPNSVRW